MTQASISPPSLSLVGCGWLGFPLAQKLTELGGRVMASKTSTTDFSSLTSWGIEPVLLRLDPVGENESIAVVGKNQTLPRFFANPTILIGIPPAAANGSETHLGQLRNFLTRINGDSLRHLVYVSSSSVYGTFQGEVDENTTPQPDSPSGELLLKAEALLTKAAREQSFGLTIVRPGGLIGPGRHPGKFLAGRTGVLHPEEPVNLIHQMDLVEQLAQILLFHFPPRGGSRIFNAVSRSHITRREFYTRASELLGLKAPEFSDSKPTDDATPGRRPRGKKVIAEKIRSVTGIAFNHDDLLGSIGQTSQ